MDGDLQVTNMYMDGYTIHWYIRIHCTVEMKHIIPVIFLKEHIGLFLKLPKVIEPFQTNSLLKSISQT